jgi:hypothetical protein
MSNSPEDPPRTDADDRPIAEPVLPPDDVDEDAGPTPVTGAQLKLEGTDRAEDERPADPDDEDEWPYGERETELPTSDEDDPYAPGLGVAGVGEPAEPNEPA